LDYKNQVNNTTWTYYFLRSASFKYSQPRDDLEFMEDFYSVGTHVKTVFTNILSLKISLLTHPLQQWNLLQEGWFFNSFQFEVRWRGAGGPYLPIVEEARVNGGEI